MIDYFMESAISKTMATPHLIAPAQQRSKPTPCGNRPTRPPASGASKIMEIWPFSVFARAAKHRPLTLAITPARPGAWSSRLKKEFERKSFLIKKTTGNNGEQSCQISYAAAFRIIMELAHNICSMIMETFRNLKDKIKDLELSEPMIDYGSFLVRKYYFSGPV